MNTTNQRSNRGVRVRRGLAVLAVGAGLVSLGTAAAQSEGLERVEGVRTALEKWVETRRIISKEQRDWVLGKELLRDRIDVIKREIAALNDRTAESEASLTEADKTWNDLSAENDALKAASASLEEAVAALEARTITLMARLPEPFREGVQMLAQRLPQDSAGTELGLSARFETLAGLLNAATRFNSEISLKTQSLPLDDGTTVSVTVLYVGLGQAYYVNGPGTVAGIGTGTAEGWTWRPANEAAPEIARAVAIIQNQAPADFVQLPLRIE